MGVKGLKREDGSLAINDKEIANLMNKLFANIGTRLGRSSNNLLQQSECKGCSVPFVSEITVNGDLIQRKLKAIKPNKSAGPDESPPKL